MLVLAWHIVASVKHVLKHFTHQMACGKKKPVSSFGTMGYRARKSMGNPPAIMKHSMEPRPTHQPATMPRITSCVCHVTSCHVTGLRQSMRLLFGPGHLCQATGNSHLP
jgi:hypothetical protein